MKKFLQNALVLFALTFLSNQVSAQTSGIFESYAVLSVNGGADAYYDMQAVTANSDFQGANLGSFSSLNTLVMKGGENKTFKNGGCNINSSTFSYRVYLTSGGPSGTFVNVNESYNGELGGGDQSWLGTSGSFNVLSGLAPGNYTIEAYSSANYDSCGTGTHFSSNAGANYSATFTINPITVTATSGSSLIASYPTLAAAITAINTAGVHSGTVVCSVAAGYAEIAPAGGYVITATGTLGNTITFVKSGAGVNPTFTANTSQTAGALNDAIFKIIGGDYITIDGFTILENGNSTFTAASNNMTEMGIALINFSTSNGCNNVTVKNCTIDMNRLYQNSFGIYANSTHSTTAFTTSLQPIAGGEHTDFVFTGNTITDVNNAIWVIGGTLAAVHSSNITIGGSLANANTITNYGTTGTFSGYANGSGTVNGVLLRNSKGINVSFNSITSSVGGVIAGTLNGIQSAFTSTAPTGTFTNNFNNNTISLRSGVVAGTIVGIALPSGAASATSTLNVSNNDFNTFGHTVAAASGTIGFINSASTHQFTTINSNTFTNLSLTTTGSVTFIANSITMPAGGSQTITNNQIVTGFTKTVAGGTVTFITSGGGSNTGTTSLWSLNNFSNVNVTGATTVTVITNTDGGTVNHNITNNTITNITGGTSAITAINSSFGGGGGSLGNVVSGNIINSISSAGAITGIAIGTSGTISSVFNNTINGLTTTGAFAVQGITSGAPTSNSIYQNKIYNLEANNASGSVNGVTVSAGTLHTIYNNIIGDLRTPTANAANALNGINITGGTTSNVYHNTVRLEGVSSGALFGSSAISVSTTPNVTLRNNIFINNSTFTGTGLSVAYRRGSATLTTYNAASDSNIYYSGTPSANNLIFSDGTNFDQTMAAFQSRVATRDTASQTENVSFISTTGSNADFLRIALGTTSFAESGGALVSTPNINTDYWNVTRPFVSPVNGGTAVDIGASEFDGIPNLSSCIAPVDQATAFVAGAVTSNSAQATFTAASSAPTGYLVITSQGAFVGTPVDGTIYSPGAALGNGAVIQSNATTAINAVGLPSNTTGTITIFSYNSGSCAGGPKYNLVTPLTGTNTTCAGTPTLPVSNAVTASGFTANWTQTGGTAFPITYTIDVTTDAAFTLPVAGSPFTSSTTSLVVSGSPATTYYWRVKGNNTVCDSAYLSGGSVTTPCLPISTFPWIESISTTGTPTCFTANESVAGASQHWTGVTADATHGAATAAAGTHFMSLNVFNASVTFNTYNLALPAFVLDSAPKQFKYSHWLGASGSATPLLVEISTDGGTVWTTLFTHAAGTSAWLNNIINLSSYANQNVIIRFKATSNFGSAFCNQGLDEFIVENIPTPITVSSGSAICAGDSTTLTVSSVNTNYTYTWSPALGIDTTTGTSVVATPATTTTYTVTAVDGAMNNSATVTVTVNAAPSMSTLGSNSPVCEGDTLSLTNTPVVLPGYSLNSNSGVTFVDIATSGTSVGTPADDSEHNITIPSFIFNGVPYTTARISNNGAVVFGATTGDIWYGNLALPVGYAASNGTGLCTSSTGSLAAILANWDDMTTSATAGLTKITTQTVGGLYIIQWTSEDNFNATGTGTITFQIQLEIATGIINLVYPDISYGAAGFDNGQSATIGLNYSATSALQYSLNTASLVDGQSLTFTPNTVNYSWTGPNSFTSTSQNPVIPAVTPTAAGTYILTVTNPVTGCFSTSTTSVSVNAPVLPTFFNPSPICAGGVVALPLVSTNGITGTWTPAPNNTLTTIYNFTPDAGQCATSGAFITQTVNPILTSTFAQVAPICSGGTFTLPTTSIEGVAGTWSPAINNTATTLYTFTPNAGQCGTTATMTVTVGTTTTWTAGTPNFWSNGAPTSIDGAIIATNYSESATLDACTLTVDNNAVVAIPAGTNVNVQGVVNVISGSMALANTANLNQSLDVTNSGNISVTCTTSPLMRQDYVLWSAPVTGQQLQSFSPGTLSNRFYTYNPSTDFYEVIASPSTTNFNEGTGYLIRVPNGHPTAPTTLSRTFTGVPNNGNVTMSVATGTWNSIGNPYPSTIDADEFITANGITDALYFWRKTNNAAGTAYATYTLAGGTSGTAPNITAPNVTSTIMTPNGTISVGQGFLAKATSSSLSFTNAMRNGDVSTQFFRTSSVDRSRVWLNLFDSEFFVNQTMIAYMPTATNAIDAAVDGRFYEDNIPTQLSSLINGEEFAVQGRAPFAVSDIVPLGFKVETAGNYSVAIDHVDGLFADGQEVFLKDNLTNTIHNLTNAPYSFVASPGTSNTRFEIVFESTLATENPVLTENTVIIFKQNQDIVVNTGSIEMKNVQVYDIQGRLLVEQKDINASTTKLSVGTTNQVLIVKVTSKDNSVVSKKVIN